MKSFSLFTGLLLVYFTSTAQVCYTASQIPYAPDPFTGIPITLTDDAVSAALPIGFVFCYFGNLYSQFYIGSNGWIGFSPGQATTFTTVGIPSTSGSVPKNCIMGPWQDWHPGIIGGPYIFYQTLGTAPNRRLVVSFNRIPMFFCTTTLGTFQIIIYESTDIIENHIQIKPNCLSWANGTAVQGIHNLSGTLALTIPGRNSSPWTTANEAYRYTPSCTNCGAMPLPVEMLSFIAEGKFNSVDVEWITATETNNDYFILERSPDAEYFTSIGRVNGSGTTNQAKQYYFSDKNPFNGTSYYRLKQVDFDGKYKYTDPLAVKIDRSEKLLINPVPVEDVMSVYFNADFSGIVQLEIINNRGTKVLNREFQAAAGSNKFEIDASNLSAGIYVVKITNDKGEFYSRIIMRN